MYTYDIGCIDINRQTEIVYFYFVRIIKLYKKTTKTTAYIICDWAVRRQQSLAEGQGGMVLSTSREFEN